MEHQSLETIDTDDINYDSFVKVNQKGVQKTGEAVLKEVKVINSDELPDEVLSDVKYSKSSYSTDNSSGSDEFFVFTGSMEGIEEDIKIYLRRGDMDSRKWDVIDIWTGTRNVSNLAGCTVPVNHSGSNFYTIENFRSHNPNSNLEDVYELYQNGILEYKEGKWKFWKFADNYFNSLENIGFCLFFVFLASIFIGTLAPLLGIVLTAITAFLISLLSYWHMNGRLNKTLAVILTDRDINK